MNQVSHQSAFFQLLVVGFDSKTFQKFHLAFCAIACLWEMCFLLLGEMNLRFSQLQIFLQPSNN